MPTFGENPPQVEAHLIGYSGDLYDRTIDLEVIDWIRDQRKFPGIDGLKQQLNRDIAMAISVASLRTAEPIASLAIGSAK